MSENLTIEHPAAALHAQLCTAKEAEAAAERAVGDAQLVALRGGGNVPGGLLDALQAARRHRQALEAGLQAADREQVAASADEHAAKRAARIDAVQRIIDAIIKDQRTLDDSLKAIAASGCGARVHENLMRLRHVLGDATESTLTPQGWLTANTLSQLRRGGPDWFDDLACEAFVLAMHGDLTAQVSVLGLNLRRGLARDLKMQPPEWPTATLDTAPQTA